jgi:DNA-binding NtrC family response regulator
MKKRLLIAEDREEFYEPLANALKESYELNFARRSYVAERALEKYAYDAVLTDVHFGEDDPLGGIKIASLASSKNTPCLVMSRENHEKEAMENGAYGFLFKKELLSMLKEGKKLSCLFIGR